MDVYMGIYAYTSFWEVHPVRYHFDFFLNFLLYLLLMMWSDLMNKYNLNKSFESFNTRSRPTLIHSVSFVRVYLYSIVCLQTLFMWLRHVFKGQDGCLVLFCLYFFLLVILVSWVSLAWHLIWDWWDNFLFCVCRRHFLENQSGVEVSNMSVTFCRPAACSYHINIDLFSLFLSLLF